MKQPVRNAYVFFSFDRDCECLDQSIRMIRERDPDAKVAVFDDGDHPLPERPDCDYYERTFFDRQKNLNGRECILGMLACFLHVRDRWSPEFVVKIDCDTLAQDPDFAKWGEFDLLGSSLYPEVCFGPLYVLRPRIIPGMLAFAKSLGDLVEPEDQAMSQLVRASGGVVTMVGYREEPRFLAGFDYVLGVDHPLERYRDKCAALTFGNRTLIDEFCLDPREVAARAMREYLAAILDGASWMFECHASYKDMT